MSHEDHVTVFVNNAACCPEHGLGWIHERLTNIERILFSMNVKEKELFNAVTTLGDGIKSLITTFDTKFAELTTTVTEAGLSAEVEATILAKVNEAQSAVSAEAAKLSAAVPPGTGDPSLPGGTPPPAADASGTAQFRLNGPTTATSGEKFSFTVESLDASGGNVQGYVGTVSFASDFAATLPDTYTFVANDGGIHTFTVTPRSTGSFVLKANDVALPTIAGSMTVTVGA